MGQCNHEEADTRIIIHLIHALGEGAESLFVRTVDTDVVVILIGKLRDLLACNQRAKIWVAFGMGRHYSLININRIYSSLGVSKSLALPVFHAFTGSDCTSQFCGIGKPTAWKAWEAYDQATSALKHIAEHPFQQLDASSEIFQKLERMTVVMYAKTSPLESVNEARMMLFSKRDLDNIPPTQVTVISICFFIGKKDSLSRSVTHFLFFSFICSINLIIY